MFQIGVGSSCLGTDMHSMSGGMVPINQPGVVV